MQLGKLNRKKDTEHLRNLVQYMDYLKPDIFNPIGSKPVEYVLVEKRFKPIFDCAESHMMEVDDPKVNISPSDQEKYRNYFIITLTVYHRFRRRYSMIDTMIL